MKMSQKVYKENTCPTTLGAPNCILAFPLTRVAAICIITASTVYAELHPCLVSSSIHMAPPTSSTKQNNINSWKQWAKEFKTYISYVSAHQVKLYSFMLKLKLNILWHIFKIASISICFKIKKQRLNYLHILME